MVKGNLKSWKPGVSGNPHGRPKGSRNIKKQIQDMLNDPGVYKQLPKNLSRAAETPLEAILCTLMTKAMRGDLRAIDVILKYSVDRDVVVEGNGFFSKNELRIMVVDGDGRLTPKQETVIDESTGTLRII